MPLGYCARAFRENAEYVETGVGDHHRQRADRLECGLCQTRNTKGSGSEQLNRFGEAFDRIRQDAVEPVAEGKLIEAAIAGMLSGLEGKDSERRTTILA